VFRGNLPGGPADVLVSFCAVNDMPCMHPRRWLDNNNITGGLPVEWSTMYKLKEL
jgi:hypothetical protein